MKREQAQFAIRLRAALRSAGIEESAVALMKRFNSRYSGASVTSQAVSGWLLGKSMPRQDKLRALAQLLDVDMHYLQTGEGPAKRLRDHGSPWPEAVTSEERRAIEGFLRLSPASRKVVAELIELLGRAGRTGAGRG